MEITADDEEAYSGGPSRGCKPFSQPPTVLESAFESIEEEEEEEEIVFTKASSLSSSSSSSSSTASLYKTPNDENDAYRTASSTATGSSTSRATSRASPDDAKSKRRRIFWIAIAVVIVFALAYVVAVTTLLFLRDEDDTTKSPPKEDSVASPTPTMDPRPSPPNHHLFWPTPQPSQRATLRPSKDIPVTDPPTNHVFSDSPEVSRPTNVPAPILTERQALIDIFEKSGGKTWNNFQYRNSWLQGNDHCRWAGVSCSQNMQSRGQVTSLNMASLGMTGELSTAIGQLSRLTTLDVSNNWLQGPIPTELGLLRELRYLKLQDNGFSGSVPATLCASSSSRPTVQADCGGTSPSVTCSCCTTCSVRFTPAKEKQALEALFNATNGESWQIIRNNWLSGDPCRERWSGVTCNSQRNIVTLNLLRFGLSGTIPTELGDLTALTILNVAHNRVEGTLPTHFGRFAMLRELFIHHNFISGTIATEVGLLRNLQSLQLGNNTFEGTIPTEIGSMTQLRALDASLVNLEGRVPTQVCLLRQRRLTSLTVDCGGQSPKVECDCCTKCTGGSTPVSERLALEEIYNSTAGPNWTVSMHYRSQTPWLVGDPCVEKWRGVQCNSEKSVVSLSLGSFGLRGTLPPSIGNLTGLSTLTLVSNGLEGTIPTEVGYLSRLLNLGMSNNLLNGSIPAQLGNLKSLQSLQLANNSLTGTIASEVGSLNQLQTFDISDNNMVGSMPSEVCRLYQSGLRELLADCAGSSPEIECYCCTKCFASETPALQRLALESIYNGTNGANWRIHQYLSTSYTPWLQGDPCSRPHWYGVECNLAKEITALKLDQAGLNGTLPSEIGYLTKLSSLQISRNALVGMIVTEIGSLSSLRLLNLESNLLTGSIPTELGKLIALESAFSIVNNTITGTLPSELGSLSQLHTLKVETNNITGTVPRELCALRQNRLNILSADCGGSEPDMECFCCTACFADATPSKERRALQALHQSTNGSDWNFAHNYQDCWLEGDPCITQGGWQGVGCNSEKSIVSLDLRRIGMIGRLPSEIGDLTALTSLVLSENTLTGPIPSEIGHLAHLITLSLRSNALTSIVPAEVGQLPRLRAADFAHNSLVGTVPDTLGLLTSLSNLQLLGNNLVGQIPQSLCALRQRNLRYLTADCAEDPPEIICSCCTTCFSISPTPSPPVVVNAVEHRALVDIYMASGGPAWRNFQYRNTWLEGNDHCRWTGVGCLYTRASGSDPSVAQVTSLSMAGLGMNGELSASIGDLSRLTNLDVSNNRLQGAIPTQLGQITGLRYVQLQDNSFAGSVPRSLCVSGSSRRTLQADCGGSNPLVTCDCCTACNARFTPREQQLALEAIFNSTNGENWQMVRNNWLSGDPCTARWSGVSCNTQKIIVSLNLARFGLSGTIPPELGDLSGLESLNLAQNGLQGMIPTQVGLLVSLREVHLSHNFISGTIATELGLLRNLQSLQLSNNTFEGTIPTEIGSITQLRSLDLSSVNLQGSVPSQVCLLRQRMLTRLVIDCGGPSPDVTCQCCTECVADAAPLLERLALETIYNTTNGANWTYTGRYSLPSSWLVGDPCANKWRGVQCNSGKSVVSLDLSSFGLRGSLPSAIGDLTVLSTLALTSNGLEGTIPTEIEKLRQLVHLKLSNNLLSGSIPAQLSSLHSLYSLLLSNNTLTGTVISEIGSLTRLRTIDVSNNRLVGSMPRQVCQLRQSHLSGLTADCAGSTPEIECYCCTRCFADETPPLQRLALEALYNSTNGVNWSSHKYPSSSYRPWLQGEPCRHPAWKGVVCNLGKDITALNLHQAGLSGTLPSEIGYLTALASLHMSRNALVGTIATELGNLSSLQSLLLESNLLEGSVPSELGKLAAMDGTLSVVNNTLTGSLPSELGGLSQLRTLAIQTNNITGKAPSQLCALRQIRLGTFSADCGGSEPEMECFCCTACFADATPSKERQALQAIHQSTNGSNWNFAHNYQDCWLEGDPCITQGGWQGVGCNAGKSIVSLNLRQIGMIGRLPTEIGDLTALTSLFLNQNTLTGPIPTEIGRLTKLVNLNFGSNALMSTIPSQLGVLLSLQTMDLSFNWLSGTVPTQLGQMGQLSNLQLHGNRVTGAIPRLLCALRSRRLRYLTADCAENPPEISCSCCTTCYPR